jgi:hypothetical protein
MSEQLIKNRNEMLHVPIGTLAKYRAEELYKLLFQISEELEKVKRTKQWIEAAIAMKYEEQICAKRLRLEKDSGVIHLEDDGFRVTADVSKKVEWNQELLTKVVGDIAIKGGAVADYALTHYSIPERWYSSWSEGVRSMFLPARIVKLGKPTYKLVRLEGDGGDL